MEKYKIISVVLFSVLIISYMFGAALFTTSKNLNEINFCYEFNKFFDGKILENRDSYCLILVEDRAYSYNGTNYGDEDNYSRHYIRIFHKNFLPFFDIKVDSRLTIDKQALIDTLKKDGDYVELHD